MDGFPTAQEVKKQVDAEIAAENARHEVIVVNTVNDIVRKISERMIKGRTYTIFIDPTSFQAVPSHMATVARQRVIEMLIKLGYDVERNTLSNFKVSCM